MLFGDSDIQPLPPTAQRVFEGVLFDVYQWEQTLFDGTTRTFEKLSRRDASIVIPVTEDGHIIITEDEQPGRAMVITFPGGGCEPGELPEETARRELLEETGYEAGAIVHVRSFQPSSKIDWTIHTFIAHNCRQVAPAACEPGERIRVRVVTLDELIDVADDERFQNRELQIVLLKARYDAEVRSALEKLLFG